MAKGSNLIVLDGRAPDAPATFTWLPEVGEKRNAFVLFRLDFELSELPATANLHLFADTRYRLRLDGKFIASGPARFVTQFPEYDSFDLLAHLAPGHHCLTVEVNFFGASSYQTMPDGKPGFIAWGGAGEVDFATPGGWQARPCEAWDGDTALLSFAQNPIELCDTRLLPESWFLPGKLDPAGWSAPTPVADQSAPWGKLTPTTAPQTSYPLTEPERILAAGPLVSVERIVGFRMPEPQDRYGPVQRDKERGPYRAFVTYLHSPRAQEVTLGLFWGDFFLNGEPLEWKLCGGNRAEATAQLREGWNTLAGSLEFLSSPERWDLLLGLPLDAGLSIHARPDTTEPHVFALAPLLPREESLACIANGRPNAEVSWRYHDGDPTKLTPARAMSWARLANRALRDLPYADLSQHNHASGAHVWNFRFPAEYLGHVTVEVEGPAGTTVDFGYDEWLREDGLIDLYRTNPFVNTVERFVLRGGRQTLEAFHHRGGRYLQVMVRPPAGDPSPVTLHGVCVRETRTILLQHGTFRCSDDLLNTAWQFSLNTLIGSCEDGYADSPWRERGTYVGDFCVNQQMHRLISIDLAAAARALRVFAQAQRPDGQIPGVAPAWLRGPHEDFALIWILALRDHWRLTGDTSVAAYCWPNLERLLASETWQPHDSGLWDATGMRVFVDWGCLREEKQTRANTCLNAFRIAALEATAQLAEALGKTAIAAARREEATRVRQIFAQTLWDAPNQRYSAGIDPEGGQLSTTPAVHGNALAWAFRIGSQEQLAATEAYVLDCLKKNFQQGSSEGQGSGHIELYFFSYLLGELAERGHAAFAEALIRETWGPLVADGFGTLPECFSRHAAGFGSRCHSWSGAPAIYASRYILGLREITPGDTSRYRFDPRPSDAITRAEGTFPHPNGPIRVKWHRNGSGKIEAQLEAPEGVEIVQG